MEFKIRSHSPPRLITEKGSILISDEDITDMLSNQFLHDIHSHSIIRSNGEYEDSKLFHYGMVSDRIKFLEKSYHDGKTIIIKDLECWNKAFMDMAKSFPPFTNAHLYLSPPGGTGLNWHRDDRDVWIMMQKGLKKFEVVSREEEVQEYLLKPGNTLLIPYGYRHRALTQKDKASVHIAFGVWPDELYIQTDYENYKIPVNLDF